MHSVVRACLRPFPTSLIMNKPVVQRIRVHFLPHFPELHLLNLAKFCIMPITVTEEHAITAGASNRRSPSVLPGRRSLHLLLTATASLALFLSPWTYPGERIVLLGGIGAVWALAFAAVRRDRFLRLV